MLTVLVFAFCVSIHSVRRLLCRLLSLRRSLYAVSICSHWRGWAIFDRIILRMNEPSIDISVFGWPRNSVHTKTFRGSCRPNGIGNTNYTMNSLGHRAGTSLGRVFSSGVWLPLVCAFVSAFIWIQIIYKWYYTKRALCLYAFAFFVSNNKFLRLLTTLFSCNFTLFSVQAIDFSLQPFCLP